jgi:hypothetical protein
VLNVTKQHWISLIGEEHVAGQAMGLIANGWRVRCEPLAMRNCTNVYLANCLAGTAGLFATPDEFGKEVGTIDLTRRGKVWGAPDIRGFANRAHLLDLGQPGLPP